MSENSLIPQAVRSLAKSCEAEKLPLRQVGSWRVFTNPVCIDKQTKSSAVFSTHNVEVVKDCEIKWIASEASVLIKAQLPANCKIGAKEVHCWVKPKAVWEIECDQFFCYVDLMANIKFRKPVRISLFGGGAIPPSFQGWKIMKLPMPRTALPAGTKMCPEETGFTIWHLIALGLFPQDFLEDFLETTTQLPKENLTNELRFHMRTLDDEYASLVNEHPSYPLTWPELKLVSAYRSTGELCQLFGKTLLGWYNLSPDAIKKLPDYIRNFPTVA